MKTIELFSCTGSFSKVAKKFNHSILRIELNREHEAELYFDILNLTGISCYDILWASPPCTGFSVASIGRCWDKDTKKPKSESAIMGLRLLDKTIELIADSKPRYWVIENPRGMMRKVIDDVFKKYGITNYQRKTITYCQYGDTRMKPTDLWMNFDWETKPPCKNGSTCHISAPRGSRTGTQGLKGNKERAVIPPALFEELFERVKFDED